MLPTARKLLPLALRWVWSTSPRQLLRRGQFRSTCHPVKHWHLPVLGVMGLTAEQCGSQVRDGRNVKVGSNNESTPWQHPTTVTKSVKKNWPRSVKKKTSSKARVSAKSVANSVTCRLMRLPTRWKALTLRALKWMAPPPALRESCGGPWLFQAPS